MLALGVLASGRGSNLQALIDACADNEIEAEIKVVISNRKSQALERAEQAGIKGYYVPVVDGRREQEAEMKRILKRYSVDIVAMAGYMNLVGSEFLAAFPNKMINIHPSLLPAFKGLNAQQQALEYGVKVTGCTVHFVVDEMDSGPIIMQQPVPVKDDDTVLSLSDRILKQEHKLYPAAVDLISRGVVIRNGRVVRSDKRD